MNSFKWNLYHLQTKRPNQAGIKKCSEACIKHEVSCEFKECKSWINFEGDHNCDLISISRNGGMSLRDVADRLDISFVRVKQIQDVAMKKLSKRLRILGQ